MSGIADLHMLTALQNGWKQIEAGKDAAEPFAGYGYTNFARMFPGISNDIRKEWWTGLVSKPVHFRAHAAPGHDDFPVVVIQLLSETPVDAPLGHYSMKGSEAVFGSKKLSSAIVRQSLLLSMMTNNAEITRALFVVVRSILLSYHKQFLKAGYLEFSYSGAEELTPEEELVADDMGVFVRKQRYDVVSQIDAYPLGVPSSSGQNWFVLSSDIKTSQDPDDSTKRVEDANGIAGGVVQQT